MNGVKEMDAQVSVYFIISIILKQWRIILLFVALSFPLSGLYYFFNENVYRSSCVLQVGTSTCVFQVGRSSEACRAREFLENPLVIEKAIKAEFRDDATVVTYVQSYFQEERRLIDISIDSGSPQGAKTILEAITAKILREHEKKYVVFKKFEEEFQNNHENGLRIGSVATRTKVILQPTLSQTPLHPVNYMIFFNGTGMAFLFGCLAVLVLHKVKAESA